MNVAMSSITQTLGDLFRKVEHIGIAVHNLDEADLIYHTMLGVPRYKTEEVISEGVRTAFYRVGETKIELLEPTRDDSPIARFLNTRGPGVHHIAFDVHDIRKSMQRLTEQGFVLTSDHPMPGADNKLVCFVHPKSAGGTLIEICQDKEAPTSSMEG
jgi:methylmalonyl-CoA/ethylmalonyl-CoA epimerase